ncbi:hypothetical protein LJC39_03750 [Parabacteroides sp. OttesenSCG-928-B22]|nr:hypothetical protein [Parabacteroides sp. OttesenSCG-928-B22]
MAKKVKQEAPKVYCRNCVYSGEENNHLIDCSNKEANPGGYKMGTWAKVCNYYGEKKQ